MPSTHGTLTFCTDCGNLLDSTSPGTTLTCDSCNSTTPNASTKTVTTRSATSAFPSSLRRKRSTVQSTFSAGELQTEAEIAQTCPECRGGKMWFYTLQIRGADEGATVFYRCACGYRFNTNN